MKSIYPACFLLGSILFGTPGCGVLAPATTAQAKAWLRVEPVIGALEVYRGEHGSYPATLDELKPRYLKETVPLEKLHEGAVVWKLYYNRKAPNDYYLDFSDGFSDATYRNGKLFQADTNMFR